MAEMGHRSLSENKNPGHQEDYGSDFQKGKNYLNVVAGPGAPVIHKSEQPDQKYGQRFHADIFERVNSPDTRHVQMNELLCFFREPGKMNEIFGINGKYIGDGGSPCRVKH